MGYVIIRPAADADEYVIWCTGTEQPLAVGDRDEIAADVAALEPDRGDIVARLDHVDLHGSSMTAYPFGWWDHGAFLYQHGRGLLPRNRLGEAARLLAAADHDTAADDLLDPVDAGAEAPGGD
ncbi:MULTISPECIES: hypothetical protein [Asanoa]|uniref:Uncharacterized protein n=2 Tax=Asanoa TaxID=195964 RepID=A0A239PFU3_9ACTN|nr:MULTISPECIES: hypothetical protein [Asanoa]GIF75667.1 hypothetical protein Asi02nite_51850 [Asanoa siamensis]SNT65860.1 hypothetical protein SAMN05421812_1286 [Asanoa hainanensis]